MCFYSLINIRFQYLSGSSGLINFSLGVFVMILTIILIPIHLFIIIRVVSKSRKIYLKEEELRKQEEERQET